MPVQGGPRGGGPLAALAGEGSGLSEPGRTRSRWLLKSLSASVTAAAAAYFQNGKPVAKK